MKNRTEEYIVNCIEENFSELCIEVAKIKGCLYEIGNSFKWVKSNDENWPSGIFDIRIDVDNIHKVVSNMVKRMEDNLLPSTVMTGPSSIPEDFEKTFKEFGLHRKYEAKGMAIDLLENKLALRSIGNLDILVVEDDELLLEWSTIVCTELFGKSGEAVKDFYNTIRLLKNKEKFQSFVARYKGNVVATSFLYLNNDIAGIYFVATHKDYRNQGIGREITMFPLEVARKKGCKIAILQASPLGEVLYKKIGFKEYCSLGRYKLD